MKLSELLSQRNAVLRQAQVANLAYAYSQLAGFAARIARGRLGGKVALRHAAPEMERYFATLTALEGSQSVLEEHFTDQDAMDLADVIAFVRGEEHLDLTFRLQDFAARFLAPVRAELARLGVIIDRPEMFTPAPSDGDRSSSDHQQIEENS